MRRGKGGEWLARLLGPRSNLDRTGRCVGRHAALGSEMDWAEDRATRATRPERRPRDQDRGGRHDAALSYPFGIGTKAATRSIFTRLSYSVSHDTSFSISRRTSTDSRNKLQVSVDHLGKRPKFGVV